MSIAALSFIKGTKRGPDDDWKNINGSNVFYIIEEVNRYWLTIKPTVHTRNPKKTTRQ
jgi:hypothetical protein